MPGLVDDLRFRGLIHQVSDEALYGKLDAGGLTVYAGFDPSGRSLHHGNLLQLCMLRRLQLGGHRPIALLGGGTGFVGDPSGKSEERNLLDLDELAENVARIRPQLARFLDFDERAGSSQAMVADNAAWLLSVPLITFLREVGKHVTVNEMIRKDSVRSRIERPNQGISYTEFSYMLLQAYDFLRLHVDHGCDMQIGGSDQWGNIALGAELVGKVTGERVFGLTTPLVTKADGTKFGKTAEGAVWLAPELTSPYRFYQFFLNVEDASVGQYLRYFTFLPREEIEALDQDTATRPERRLAQRALARELTDLVHGTEERERAERAAAALFGEDLESLNEATLLEVFEDAPSSRLGRSEFGGNGAGALDIVEALTRAGLCRSKSDARREIAQGGIYVNNRPVRDPKRALGHDDLLAGRYVVLRRGRRNYHLLKVE